MDETRRLKLIIGYDGTSFAGWQRQKNRPTIQGELEKAFYEILRTRLAVIGAGRTDAGVHALAQCAHADVPRGKFAPARWQSALNGILSRSIRILRAQFVPATFHARFSAREKVYRYRIIHAPVLPPLEINRAWQVWPKMDFEILRRGAQSFVGEHNFAGFAANRGQPPTDTRRTITLARVRQRGGLVEIEFRGNGFLYKMVRLMVGAMVNSARGKQPPEAIVDQLLHRKLSHSRLVAPAVGLFLVRIIY